MKELRKIYQEAFDKELAERKTKGELGSALMISVHGEPLKKVVFDKGNYGSGSNRLKFKYNTAKNRELKKKLEKTGYALRKDKFAAGFYFTVSKANHGDKYYEIETIAYQKVADYLIEQGYDVCVESKTDLSKIKRNGVAYRVPQF